MRPLLFSVLALPFSTLAVLGGCSLDLARLRGDASMGLDAPSVDAPGADVPGADVPGADVPEASDAGEPGPPQVTDTETFDAAPGGLAVGPHPDGARVAVVVPTLGQLHTFVASGTGCGITLLDASMLDGTWLGVPVVAQLDSGDLPDIVAQSRPGQLTVLLDTGPGGFEPEAPLEFTDVDRFAALAAGRLDDDAAVDLFAVQRGARLFRILGTGDGRFATPTMVLDVTREYLDGAVADLDGVNGDDLASVASTASGLFFEAHLSSGAGTFVPRSIRIGDFTSASLAVGPPNGSSRRPLYALAGDALWVGEISGSTIVVSGPFALGPALTDITVADVDGDGETEVVVSSSGSVLHVTRYDAGLVTPLASIPVGASGAPSELAAIDVDGDHRDELFVITDEQLVVISPGCTSPP